MSVRNTKTRASCCSRSVAALRLVKRVRGEKNESVHSIIKLYFTNVRAFSIRETYYFVFNTTNYGRYGRVCVYVCVSVLYARQTFFLDGRRTIDCISLVFFMKFIFFQSRIDIYC